MIMDQMGMMFGLALGVHLVILLYKVFTKPNIEETISISWMDQLQEGSVYDTSELEEETDE